MSLLQNETLSVKIVTADYYMYKPIPEFGEQCYSAFKSSPIYRVPVIRIFGPTLEGVKTCVHIHGVFPYIFVPNWNNEISDKDLYNFAVHLDKAINTSFAHSNSKSSHVHKITKVSGIPFYGYHECEKNFLKIEFYNPAMVKRASDLLLNGAVLNTIFQPHEAHIPYILQFFIDNNLYGMNNITFSSYKIRKKYSQDDLNLNETIIQSSNDTSQQSYSKLEVDIIASNLCSTLTNEENIPNNPGLAFIWEDEKKRRRFNQKSSQITPNESQQRPEKPITRTELYFREKLLQKLQSIKDNETLMEIENEETPSLNSTYEELNTQSRSLLALLEDLAGQAKKNDVPKSGSSSPSLVYSDDEVANVADISSISSQPVLKFNAEDDSILGNNFSDDENDIDDNDHKTLSQSIIYLRHNHTSSSDDSESESNIPQLDGACDTKTPNKSKSKKSTNAKNKITKSRKEIIKVSKNNQSQDNLGDEKIYNLRSRNKPGEKSKPTENFQPKDFKIILSRLDTKFSPRKTYPRLNIDTQKSPRSNSSKSFSDENDNSSFKTTISNVRNESLPSLPENQSIKVSKSADNSGILKNDKVSFPQLQINVKKSPRSYQAFRKSNLEPSSTILHGLKKRKINFGSEENDTKSKEPGGDMDLMSVKWKKSLKRRKKDETCFKIGQSFSLLEFRDSKRDHNVDGKLTDDIELTGINYLPDSREISSQSYSLRVRGTKSFNVYCDSTEKSIDVDDESGEMESLQIPESDTINDKNVDKSENIDDFEKTRELEMPPKSDFSFPKNPSTSGSQSRGGTLKIPILRIPRLQMDTKSVTVSPPLYENSFIELDVFKSNGENTNTMVDLATSQPPSLAVKKQEDLKNFQQVYMENNCVKSEKSKKPTSPDIEVTATPQKRLFVETKKAEENSVKAAKNQASKKKCLGMRIRKNLKSKTSQIEDPISILPPIYHDYQAEKLPETLVNSEIGRTVDNRNIRASPEPYPDSFIELNISKSNVESLPKNNHDIKGKSPLISDSSVQSKDEKTKDLPSIVNNENSCIENSEIELDILKYCSKPTKDITKEDTEVSKSIGNVVREKSLISDSSVQSKDEKAKDVPRVINDKNSFFENSDLELDIFKHCSILVDEITKENTSRSKFTRNVDLATSRIPESNESEHENENEKVSFTPSNDYDFCNQECLLRQDYIHNENMATPQSSLCDKFPAEKNHKSFHSSVNNTDTSSNQEITLDQKHKQNENLATSQSFSHVVLTKCENVSVMEDAEMFCDEELLLLEPEVVENRNLASSQTMLDKNTALDENMGLSEYLGSDYETLFSQETPYTRDHKNTKSLATSQSFVSVASNKFDKSSDIPTECGTRDDDISSKIDSNSEDAATSQQSFSNDSLLNVLDALSPRTREALNKKLDLTESSPDFQNDVINRSSSHLNDNVGSTNVATLPIPQHSKKSNTSEDFHSQNSPNILDKSRYNDEHSIQPSQEILFDEDSLRLEIPSTSHDSRPRSNSPVKKPTLEKLLLNNSIWDSIDSDHSSDEDNEIQSFYHNQTINPAHITVIRDIAEDDSSPMAKSLTPESVSNEILSFYGSQSPDSMICSIGEDLNVVSKSSNESDSSQGSRKRSTESVSPVKLHSTPTTSSAKKSPSPVYTPILKKLMIKTVSKAKRRISSQRFRAEPFLPEIKEEEEKQIKRDANTTLSLPLELECDTSKIGKSLNTSRTSTCSGASYQIDGATLENSCGFKMNLENLQDIKTDKQFQFITQMSLEIFAITRGNLRPDPEYDAVTCLFYSIHHDAPDFANLTSGIIIVDVDPLPLDVNRFKCDKTLVSSESQLFDEFLALVRKWDPDMLIGYEVEMLSWGFLIQRGYHLGRNLSQELSRVRVTKQNEPLERPAYEDDEYSNEIKLPGRIVLNVWRLMRHEVNLQSYTFENILFHVLHQRAPYHTFKFLTECWKNASKKWIVIDYFLFRAESNITLLEQLDFICRTSELARLFGIQFYEVLSRGSQFRVESMMLRLAKTQNYVAVSPSVRQRANMRAPESLPLIMEPESKFYTDPVVVLDFQSLYPSIIIAYNYCFSTCLGRIDSLGQNEPFHFGCIEHTIAADLLLKLEPHLNLSPAGVAFVDKTIRKGILPSMLEEILETRLMVKKSMKENKNNSILKRVLHARQLGLKLIANVTYGYTSANFSGRMPCMEIADSVVSKGRETLERAIELVNSTENWGARVVYGDTDSLFVLVPNRSKEEAFRIGAEIADAVTSQNPKPVKLKLEKVYSASVLQTKKRYVGYMYESADQEKPTYDAKGIETVRRDGCPAVSKILEKSLKLLFETKNVNTVKQYVQRQFTKLICGRISIQELTFAREYRGMSNYKPAACVPALQLAKQALLKDRRSEPRIKERVRYVIISGAPGVPLIRLVRTPEEFLDTPGSLINTEYYITRVIIPALDRCFTLLKVNVHTWYTELPKKQRLNLPIDYEFRNKAFKKTTISHYFSSSKCISCSKVAGTSVCRQCEHKPQRLALILGNMINQWQRKHNNVAKICRSCCARNEPIGCSSLDCPVYYLFRQTAQDAEQVRYAENLKREYLYF